MAGPLVGGAMVVTRINNAGITEPTGLVNYWPCDAGTSSAGGSTDIIGGNGLVATGSPATAAGQLGQAWDLEFGSSQFLAATSADQGPQSALTVCLWVKPESIVNFQIPFSKYSTSNPAAAYFQSFSSSDGSMNCRIHQVRDTTFIGRSAPASTLVSGSFQHLAFTWSGGTTNAAVKIYKNGSQVDNGDDGAGTFTGPYSGSDIKWATCQWDDQGANDPGFAYDGLIEDIRVYNVELTSTQVDNIYQAGLLGNR